MKQCQFRSCSISKVRISDFVEIIQISRLIHLRKVRTFLMSPDYCWACGETRRASIHSSSALSPPTCAYSSDTVIVSVDFNVNDHLATPKQQIRLSRRHSVKGCNVDVMSDRWWIEPSERCNTAWRPSTRASSTQTFPKFYRISSKLTGVVQCFSILPTAPSDPVTSF